MLQKESWAYITDNTNVKWVKIFQLYKGSKRKQTSIGFFNKGSCRVVEPPRIEYKGFKYKYSLKGDISKQLLVRSKKQSICLGGKTFLLNSNDCICITKKQQVKSRYLSGPSLKTSNRKRINSLFMEVI